MFIRQVQDIDAFLEKARAIGKPIRVVRSGTVVPVSRTGAVVMHPAVSLQYSIDFSDAGGDNSWVYRETVLVNERGEPALQGSLWEKLQTTAVGVKHVVVQRSGSL
jgi:hypothetical protein